VKTKPQATTFSRSGVCVDKKQEGWDLSAAASDDEAFEIEMTRDDVMNIPFLAKPTGAANGNHTRGIQPQDRA
jgi:hypothetical protein